MRDFDYASVMIYVATAPADGGQCKAAAFRPRSATARLRALIVCSALGALLAGTGLAAADETATPSGAQLYASHCASCHGPQGEGDGPAAAAMQINVPNLRMLSIRNDGTFPLAAVLAYVDGRKIPRAHGSRYMPVWGDIFAWGDTDRAAQQRARQRINAIVAFVEKLQYH
jgi:mono/diheme cytochrome c family protein